MKGPEFGSKRRRASSPGGTEAARKSRATSRALCSQRQEEQRLHGTQVHDFETARGGRGRGVITTHGQQLLAIGGYLLYDASGKLQIAAAAPSETTRLLAGMRLSGLSRGTVTSVVAQFKLLGAVKAEAPGKRGPRSPNLEELIAMEGEVRQWVAAQLSDHDQPRWVTRHSLCRYIWGRTGLAVSSQRNSELVKHWGLEYGELTRSPHASTPARYLWRRVALYQQRWRLLQGNAEGTFDESFANQRLGFTHSFYCRGSPFAAWATRRGAGLGKRICWMHGLWEKGMCGGLENLPAVGDITSSLPHCEMMFEAGTGDDPKDYHGNFNSGVFRQWVGNRLIPWFKHAFPHWAQGKPGQHFDCGKGFAAKFDNASYHGEATANLDPAAGPVRFDPHRLSKPELFAAMAAVGCKSLTVPAHTYFRHKEKQAAVPVAVLVNDAEAAKRAKGGAVPYLPQLAAAALQWLVARADDLPFVLMNDLEYVCHRETNGNLRVFWNAPNFPEFVACESAWMGTKAYARVKWTGSRNLTQLAQDIHDGLYTDKVALPGVFHTRGQLYVPGPDGKCPAAESLINHVLHGKDGGAQMQIDSDAVLCKTAHSSEPATLRNLVIPAAYASLAQCSVRAILKFHMAEMLATDENMELGQAIQVHNDEEEEEEK